MLHKTFLCLLCAASMTSSASFAQIPPPTSPGVSAVPRLPVRAVDSNETDEKLGGNYVLTLVLKDKETEVWALGMVTATRSFNSSTAQPSMSFNGRLVPQEDGAFLVDYQLGRSVAISNGGSTEYRNAATKSSVLLRLGEPVQIIKDGNQVVTLKLERSKP